MTTTNERGEENPIGRSAHDYQVKLAIEALGRESSDYSTGLSRRVRRVLRLRLLVLRVWWYRVRRAMANGRTSATHAAECNKTISRRS